MTVGRYDIPEITSRPVLFFFSLSRQTVLTANGR